MKNKITQTEWEQAEARDRRRNQAKRSLNLTSTPTSNNVLDGLIYSGYYSESSTSNDSWSSSCDSSSDSSSPSSCD